MMHEPDRPSLLSAELRRLVRLRWFAGAAIILATVGNGLVENWSPAHGRTIALGAVILAYNGLFWAIRRRLLDEDMPPRALLLQAWVQLLPDLVCLALLVLWTGGLASPVLLVFVLHMVLASLLLSPATAYAVSGVAMLLVFGGLWGSGQLPADRLSLFMAMGWTLTLLLTVYLTNHITRGLRESEAELRGQNRRTQAILEAAADGIITIDEQGIVRSVNRAAEQIFGYDAMEMIGRNVSVLMPEPFRSEHDSYVGSYLRTGKARIIGIGREAAGRRKDGTLFPIELAVSEVDLGGGRLFTGIVRDISERKRAEAELKQVNGELLRQQAALVQHEKMAAMGKMAAGVAHEIANPLASMDSHLQLAARHPDRLGPESVRTLRDQIARIEEMLRQMKEFAHPVETAWEAVSINALVEHALEMIRFDQRTRHVEMVHELSPEVGTAHVMPHTIEQIIVNLVLNAMDALVGAPEPRLTVSTRPEPGGCVIEVWDNGKGIAPEYLERVFDPFFTTKPVGQGTGLGLSISYSLAERNKGRLEVSSRPGEGTTFSLHLPAAGTL